jgi:hypothetical protein
MIELDKTFDLDWANYCVDCDIIKDMIVPAGLTINIHASSNTI